MNASRRRFLIWSAALTTAVAAGVLWKWPRARESASSFAQRLLRARQTPEKKLLAHFDYLKIPDEVAQHYVTDYCARVRDVGRLSDLDDDFYTRFLLSTDFFQHDGDESRTLAYIAIYGPTITLCYNPLARLD